jgi:hypothetical protein
MIFLPDTAPVNEPNQGFLVKKPLRVIGYPLSVIEVDSR